MDQQRKSFLSLARCICALAVVIIHTNECFNEFNIDSCWLSANIIDCGLGFAVPIFIMISGACLLDYNERYNTKSFFVKRIEKTVIPFIIWMFIGRIYGILTGNDGIFFIYYFFFYLFGVYLYIPIFAFLKNEYKEKVIFYVVIVAFILEYAIPFLCMINGLEYSLKIPFEIGSGFIIYALIGYLISSKEIHLWWRIPFYVFSIFGFLLHIDGTYFESIDAGYIVDKYRGYTNLPCFLTAIGMFVLIKQISIHIKNESIINIIEWISKHTFSVYLLHYYIINSFVKNLFFERHSLEYRLGSPFLTFAICIMISWIVRKIPVVKKLLP